MEYQDEVFKTYYLNAQKIVDVDFMTLNILNLDFFHIPWIHYKLEVYITKICRETSI